MFYLHENVQSLEQISLRGFLFNPNQPSFVTFASPKNLCIFDCVIDDATLKELMSNCPVLESLAIDSCYTLLNLRLLGVKASGLNTLYFVGLTGLV